MTMGWHSIMEFTPSLIGCIIASSNHAFDLVRKSKACVINIPTTDMIDQIVGIGTTSGRDTDKFKHFHLTAEPSEIVHPPSIKECYASFECQLADDALIDKYNFFVWEVVAARVAVSPEYPETVHYRGQGTFMLSGKHIHRPELRGM
jgi:flavin reductase (DIM6/NTAB) family NADH-FMN oxidoreductase RutF